MFRIFFFFVLCHRCHHGFFIPINLFRIENCSKWKHTQRNMCAAMLNNSLYLIFRNIFMYILSLEIKWWHVLAHSLLVHCVPCFCVLLLISSFFFSFGSAGIRIYPQCLLRSFFLFVWLLRYVFFVVDLFVEFFALVILIRYMSMTNWCNIYTQNTWNLKWNTQ